MKHTKSILLILLLIMIGCGQKKTDNYDFITVDITKNPYPKKEVILQDFMDVEYIPLETTDDFINQGFVMDIGKEIILVRNRVRDGDIFVYDRTGKALRKLNRRGGSGEEYVNIIGIALDEENNEMFINSRASRKIQVYDLFGNFKRSLVQQDSDAPFYTDIFNYDRNNLICYNMFNENEAFVLISKHDGSITKEIKIPFKEMKRLMAEDGTMPSYYPSIIPYKGSWIILEHSSDTVYTFSSDYNLHPFIVRTPPILSMDPGVFLVLRLLSDRYYFMETVKYIYDSETGKFPKTFLMYDKQEKTLSGYSVYNGDFTSKKEVYLSVRGPVNHEIESWCFLEPHQLVESYNKGELKGKLKEIAATLDEDSNPVIMLIKHKK